MPRILVTGSEGLIGSALTSRLTTLGWEVAGFDRRGPAGQPGDFLQAATRARAMYGCVGVVHLAAVSRVTWAEADPVRCREVNVDGTRNVLAAALSNWLSRSPALGLSRQQPRGLRLGGQLSRT